MVLFNRLERNPLPLGSTETCLQVMGLVTTRLTTAFLPYVRLSSLTVFNAPPLPFNGLTHHLEPRSLCPKPTGLSLSSGAGITR